LQSIDTAKTQHGSGYTLDANSIASLDMTAYSPSQVMVKQANGGFFSETPIRLITCRLRSTRPCP